MSDERLKSETWRIHAEQDSWERRPRVCWGEYHILYGNWHPYVSKEDQRVLNGKIIDCIPDRR